MNILKYVLILTLVFPPRLAFAQGSSGGNPANVQFGQPIAAQPGWIPVLDTTEGQFTLAVMMGLLSGASVEEIAKGLAESTARAYAIDAVGSAINSAAGTASADTAAANSVTAASTLLFVWSFIQAIKNYADADTGTQRYYAASDAVAAYITYVFPPAGAVAGLAAAGQRLAGAFVASSYSREINGDYEAAQKLSEETFAMRVALAKTEQIERLWLNKRVLNFQLMSTAISKRISESCTDLVSAGDIKLILACGELFEWKAIADEGSALSFSQWLRYPGRFMGGFLLMEGVDSSDKSNEERKKLVKLLKNTEVNLNMQAQKSRAYVDSFRSAAADFWEQVLAEPNPESRHHMDGLCVTELSHFITTARNLREQSKTAEGLLRLAIQQKLKRFSEAVEAVRGTICQNPSNEIKAHVAQLESLTLKILKETESLR